VSCNSWISLEMSLGEKSMRNLFELLVGQVLEADRWTSEVSSDG